MACRLVLFKPRRCWVGSGCPEVHQGRDKHKPRYVHVRLVASRGVHYVLYHVIIPTSRAKVRARAHHCRQLTIQHLPNRRGIAVSHLHNKLLTSGHDYQKWSTYPRLGGRTVPAANATSTPCTGWLSTSRANRQISPKENGDTTASSPVYVTASLVHIFVSAGSTTNGVIVWWSI